jgi:hypothetical protein
LIRSDEWKDIELQFDERTLGSIPPNVCAVRRRNDPRSSSIAYVLVHFFSTEFYTRFPINEAAVQKHPRLAPARLAVAKVLDDLYAEGVGHRNELILAIENFDHELERQKLIDWSNRVIAKSDDEYVAMREKSDFRTLNLFEPIFHSSKGKTRQQQDLEAMWTEKLARLKVIVRKVGS